MEVTGHLFSSEEVKKYLQVNTVDEEDMLADLLQVTERICEDAVRLKTEQWEAVSFDTKDAKIANATSAPVHTDPKMGQKRVVVRPVAIAEYNTPFGTYFAAMTQ